ncbi:hypothetical protein [Mesoterricola silvestris]|uniref:Calcineurin-like phosphoesterase domain-containing protein n=1 Tax=Mesoterricola silvestris TaxID=2927979 RepID=A0AA48H917_9BACT|nr:hypothetical protein [Mesoterricola silvestris]BDU74013.1 hypothetical protein METEAL_31870 [Mesoterricola silvestris]
MPLPVGIIISDIHLGDPRGVVPDPPMAGCATLNGVSVRQGWVDWMDRVDQQLAAQGEGARIPYLVLNGDFWDIAIRNVDEAAALSLDFFRAVEVEKRFSSILFLPGNHDHYLWSLVQIETSILRPLENLRQQGTGTQTSGVWKLPHSQCATLDFRKPGGPELSLWRVKPPYVGNVFAGGLTGGRIPVNVAYPNLHLLRPSGGACVVTHGHFFQQAWTLISDLLRSSLGPHIPGGMDLYCLELLDAGLTDFINYSLGQVGPLSSVVQGIYDQVRMGKEPPEIAKILSALRKVLDDAVSFTDEPWWKAGPLEWGSDRFIDFELLVARKLLESAIKRAGGGNVLPKGRNVTNFLKDPENCAKIADYLDCTQRDPSVQGVRFDEMVFGHTHETISGDVLTLDGGRTLKCWNTGSLVSQSDRTDFMPLAIDAAGLISPF